MYFVLFIITNIRKSKEFELLHFCVAPGDDCYIDADCRFINKDAKCYNLQCFIGNNITSSTSDNKVTVFKNEYNNNYAGELLNNFNSNFQCII